MIAEFIRLYYSPESLNHRLFMTINHAHHPLLDPLMAVCITLGSSRMVYWYAALMLLVYMVRRDIMPFRYVWLYCVAVAIGIWAEELLKGIFLVPRPAMSIGREKLHILGEVKLRNSFPSGHATFSFLTAHLLSHRRSIFWKVPLFGGALLVGWSRVYVGAHYPLDVFGGAVVGMAVSALVWCLYDAFHRRSVKQQPGIKEEEQPP